MTKEDSPKETFNSKKADKLQIIIPTLNECDTLPFLLKELKQYTEKVIVIDGGSIDGTVTIAEEYGASVIQQTEKGKGAAVCQAFKEADGDPVIILDADGSMRPIEIPIFLKRIDDGADLVKGSRFLKGGYSEDMSFFRYLGNRFFVGLINFFFSEKFSDLCYGYIAMNNKAIKKLTPLLKSKYFEIETEIIIKAKKLDLTIVEAPSIELKRLNGDSKLRTLHDGFSIFKLILNELINY
ncbi:MAG: glycosyltransferase family 2 protein [Candidatus Thermoplasmatota archaeon]|nr:glycosyltransferase family 2 protein [Candidatus Thermoplasmatota archaeon]